MFHRANANIKPQTKKEEKVQAKAYSARNAKSPVERYAHSLGQPQDEEEKQNDQRIANQNRTAPYVVKRMNNHQEKKELNPMNNPKSQAKNNPSVMDNDSSAQSQARVDIPGSNFQRPNAAMGVSAPQQASRPSYPGSYPTATAAEERQLVIGQGITMSGEIGSCDHLIVEGTVEAALKGANMMDIAESGSFYGTVEIDEANIAGRFEGDITVKGRLTIQSTGVVIGSVSYKELAIEAGATMDGSVSPIGSQNAVAQGGRKRTPTKAKKVSQDNGIELPFTDKTATAAE